MQPGDIVRRRLGGALCSSCGKTWASTGRVVREHRYDKAPAWYVRFDGADHYCDAWQSDLVLVYDSTNPL